MSDSAPAAKPVVFASSLGDPDIVLVSQDGFRFHAHKSHLQVHSDVFADLFNSAVDTSEEEEEEELPIVSLTESTPVLKLCLPIFYNVEPAFSCLPYFRLMELYDFFEKYQVLLARQHILDILTYNEQHHKEFGLELYTLAATHKAKKLSERCKPYAFTTQFRRDPSWRRTMGVDAAAALYEYNMGARM